LFFVGKQILTEIAMKLNYSNMLKRFSPSLRNQQVRRTFAKGS